MKTTKEVLNIAKQFHISYGGNNRYMCACLITAVSKKLITPEEDEAASIFIMKDLLGSFYASVRYMLADQLGKSPTQEEIKSYWENVINSLE